MDGIESTVADGAPRSLTIAALADGIAEAPLLDDDGQLIEPMMVIDLDADTESSLEPAISAARRCDRVLVGVATEPVAQRCLELAEALDVTLTVPEHAVGLPLVGVTDPAREVAMLHAAAIADPEATLALASVLHATGGIDVASDLDVESFAYSTLLGGTEFARWFEHRGQRPAPPPAQDAPVLLNRHDDWLRITLNRPERRNAYGREVRDGLVEALRMVEMDPSIQRIILDGAGPSFCAGGDLDEFGTTPDLARAHLVRTRGGAGRLLHRHRDRIEVHLHGSCVGAGIELPAFASHVTAHPETIFRLPEVSMGLIPGAGGTISIPRRIGRWRCMYLALSGKPLGAPTALKWGLIDNIAEASRDDNLE